MNGSFLELDLQIKELGLAIEVQGPTHYSDLYGNFDEVKRRDEFKRDWCLKHNIKLMHIEWEGYTKNLYRMPEAKRRDVIARLVKKFLSSDQKFCELREDMFMQAAST